MPVSFFTACLYHHNTTAEWDHHWSGARPLQLTSETNTKENPSAYRRAFKPASAKHKKKRVFRCHLCPYTSCTNSNVIRHVRVHTGERPFRCTVCSFASTQRHDLTVHMLLHTGEKPFSCRVCGMPFRRKGNLKRHAVRVHRECSTGSGWQA